MHPSGPRERIAVVDYLKTTGILFVVLIHAMRDHFDPNISSTEFSLKAAITFAVPFFFAASGYLYCSAAAIPFSMILRRMKRILVPYLIASIAGQVFWYLNGKGNDPFTIAIDFLSANTFGIYYFVLVLFLFVLLTYPLSRMPRRWVPILFLLSLAGLALHTYVRPASSLAWQIRDPLLWLHVFLFGWLIRRESDRVRVVMLEYGRLILVITLSVFALCTWLLYTNEPSPKLLFPRWMSAYALTAGVFALTWNKQSTPTIIRFLSDSTYTVYLYHIFFVLAFKAWASPAPRAFEPGIIAATWLSGFFGALAILLLVRVTAGERSRLLVGG